MAKKIVGKISVMSLEDKIKYKADLDKMKRDIAKIKLEQSESKADDEWCHYSGMPSPEAYSQSNEALIARHKNKLSSEFQAQEPWVDNEDDDDDYSSGGNSVDGGDYGDDSNEY